MSKSALQCRRCAPICSSHRLDATRDQAAVEGLAKRMRVRNRGPGLGAGAWEGRIENRRLETADGGRLRVPLNRTRLNLCPRPPPRSVYGTSRRSPGRTARGKRAAEAAKAIPMRFTCVLHASYMLFAWDVVAIHKRLTCVSHASLMRLSCVVHAMYMRLPCVVRGLYR